MTNRKPSKRDNRHGFSSSIITKRHNVKRGELPPPDGYPTTGHTTLSEALGREVRQRAEMRKGERIKFKTWSNKTPEPKTGALDWWRFPFQAELYSQKAAKIAEIAVKKPTQMGISAYLLRWILYWSDMRAATGLYVFPKLKQMYDFSDARVKPVINASVYLRERVHGTQNKGLKEIGHGVVYFRGSDSQDDLDSIDADTLALDEYDRLEPKNIPIAERRISGPRSMAMMRRVGVPTIPGFGISRLYEESDQRVWIVKCEHCGESQRLVWVDNVDQERRLRVCRMCRKELTPDAIREGEWVPTHPDREVRGYAMSKLIVPDLTENALIKLIANSKKTLPEDRQAFWNRDMGEGYSPAEGRLSKEAIAACCTAGAIAGAQADGPVAPSFHLRTMGIDVASTRHLHVRISEHHETGKKRSLYIGAVEDFAALDRLMIRYGVHMAVIDHLPDGRSSRAFADRFAGKVYLIAYTTAAEKVLRINDDARLATIRRVDAIDAMMDMVRQQRNLLPEMPPDGYVDHMTALHRVAEKDDSGRKKVRYESTGADDFAHAEVYDLVASELFWMRAGVNELEADEYTFLEDHMDVERSVLGRDEDTYIAGPGGDGYEPGMGD